jgi:CheY-like chemotaxis protein
LIVEDDDSIRETMKLLVEEEGFDAMTARNGQEALDLLRTHIHPDPCVILLDLMMPVMDGWQFLETRRATRQAADIPVVVMSAAADPRHPPRGALKILAKPMEIDNLCRSLHELCDPVSRARLMAGSAA